MPTPEPSGKVRTVTRRLAVAVIILRLIAGATFIISGFVKMIDLYGFIFKIEEYLAVWGWSLPRSVTLLGAMMLCAVEFVGGCMLVTGMLKRAATWLLTLVMAAMTLLTAWIFVMDPVSDCGCFGEFIKLSNDATFAKNIVLLAALLFLCRYNARVRRELLHPAIQWLGITVIALYIIIIGLYGYNIEPMLDFRPFPVGSGLVASPDEAEDGDEEDEDLRYVYSKDGVERTFGIDELPDSTWTFVDAVGSSSSELERREVSALTVYDDNDEDVTSSVIDGNGKQLFLIIPEPVRMDISYTFRLNELYQWTSRNSIRMIALIAANRDGIERWRDLSMAAYPCYTVEDTKLKELSRGIMSLVYVDNGRIVFKRNLSSITADDIDNIISGRIRPDDIAPATHRWLIRLSVGLVALLTLITALQDTISVLVRRIRRFDKRLSHKSPDTNSTDKE